MLCASFNAPMLTIAMLITAHTAVAGECPTYTSIDGGKTMTGPIAGQPACSNSCTRSKLGDIVAQSCDTGGAICGLVGASPGTCCTMPGSGQKMICDATFADAPEASDFTGCSTCCIAGACGSAPAPPPPTAVATAPTTAPTYAAPPPPTAVATAPTTAPTYALSGNCDSYSTHSISDGKWVDGSSTVTKQYDQPTAACVGAAGGCVRQSFVGDDGLTVIDQSCDSAGFQSLTAGYIPGICEGAQQNTCCTSGGSQKIICSASGFTGAPTAADFTDCSAVCTNGYLIAGASRYPFPTAFIAAAIVSIMAL